jgi:hypothetical protein
MAEKRSWLNGAIHLFEKQSTPTVQIYEQLITSCALRLPILMLLPWQPSGRLQPRATPRSGIQAPSLSTK